MAEVKDVKGVKLIAFYLPQFHAIPLNDQCWGKGFTEWTNVRKAQALFSGHDQPKIPLDLNYYDLMDDQVKIRQSNLAEKYGIFGFCYYHYWFKHGEKLLEKPAELMLKNKKIEIPLCFCWANVNLSKNWDGGDQEIIMEQDYGGKEEWERHFQYLLNFFQDERYITVDGCPLLVVYKPEQMIFIRWHRNLEEEQKKKVFRIYVWPFNFRRIIQICITETIFLIIKLNLSLYIHEISKARSYLEQAEKFL